MSSSSVLQPDIVAIGPSRRYRRNPFKLSFHQEVTRPYVEETEEMFEEQCVTRKPCKRDEYEDEACGLDSCKVKVVKQDGGQEGEDYSDITVDKKSGLFRLELEVAGAFMGYLIGRKGEQKARLEAETRTRVRIPRAQEGQVVTVEGKSKADLVSCKNRILLLIQTARNQKPFTHMLTFPLNFEPLIKRFYEFKRQVLERCPQERGIDESLFQNPAKLHLTITILTLASDAEVDQAANILAECRRTFIKDILAGKELRVRIRGLEYMNDDPSEVDVLYARVQPLASSPTPAATSRQDDFSDEPIQRIADGLMKRFVESGLARKQYDRVKLHSTLMNTLLRQETAANENQNQQTTTASQASKRLGDNRDRESFDARNVLRHFGDYDFGEFTLNEVHISVRFTTGADGFFDYASKVSISNNQKNS